MQHLSSTELSNCIDCSSFDDSINFEDFLSNKNEKQLPLPKLFAVLRTWNSSVHQHFAQLILRTLKNEINIDEHDLTTGMNLLHFACKFGAKQIGHEQQAIQVINALIERGINLSARCLWIQMNCLHYCAFFDSPRVCELLIKHSKVLSLINQPCSSLKENTPLHLACAALALSTTRILLQAGANKQILNDQHRISADCIPTPNIDEQRHVANALRALLYEQESLTEQQSTLFDSIISTSEHQATTHFQIGERAQLTNNKIGTIRYFGSVPFGVNLWYGIELDEPTGKHDGCVGGVRYFTCPPNRGIFVQPSSIQKLTPVPHSPERERRFRPINFPMPDTSSVSSRVDTGLKRDNSVEGRSTDHYQINDRVSLSKNRYGTVKYVGSTPLGSGVWYGIELDLPDGLHDGCLSVDGQRYFQCKPQHGVFVRGQNLKKLNDHDRRTHSLERKRSARMTTSDYDTTMMTTSVLEDDPFSKSMDSNIHSITFHAGDKVYYHNHLAFVRYIGTTLFAEGIWIGIEFVSRSLGKNDGSVNDHVYFQCKPNYGLFVRPNRLKLTKS